MTNKTDRLLSIQRIAQDLGVSVKTIRRWIARGELPFYKLGRQLRVSPKDLDIFLKLRRNS